MGNLFTQLFHFLKELLTSFLAFFYNLLVDLINMIIEGIALAIRGLLIFFPNASVDISPPQAVADIINYIAWFIPLDTIVICLGIIGGTYVAYFSLRPVLKLFHVW